MSEKLNDCNQNTNGNHLLFNAFCLLETRRKCIQIINDVSCRNTFHAVVIAFVNPSGVRPPKEILSILRFSACSIYDQ